MPSQNIHVIAEAFKNLEEASDAFAVLQKQFRYFQEHIDVENIISKSLTSEVIKAGSITADEITVSELSALSANLGHIIAGLIESVQIFGSYIATRNGTYPRAEMNESNNLFAALASVNQYLNIGASGGGSVPYIEFRDLSLAISAIINLGSFFKIESQKRMDLTSISDDIFITANNIRLQNTTRIYFSNLIDNLLGTSLSAQLSAKANGTGISGTVYVASTPGGAANTAITFNNGVRQS